MERHKSETHAKREKLNTSSHLDAASLSYDLHFLLLEQVSLGSLEALDAQLLSLRLGLEDGHCASLKAIGEILGTSAEWVRQRQCFLLKKKIRDPRFLQKLDEYSRFVHLPRGVILQRRSPLPPWH